MIGKNTFRNPGDEVTTGDDDQERRFDAFEQFKKANPDVAEYIEFSNNLIEQTNEQQNFIANVDKEKGKRNSVTCQI